MNAEHFMELLNTLPDEMLVSAAQAAQKRNRKPIIYLISAVAACLVIGLTAAVYPKLRTQTPEIVPPNISSETTTQTELTTTSVSSATQTTKTSASLTTTIGSQTVSTAESSVIFMTSAQSVSAAETVSEQTATTEQTIQTTLTTASATATQNRLTTTTTTTTTVRTTISTTTTTLTTTTTTADEHKGDLQEQSEIIPTKLLVLSCAKTKLNVSLSPGPTDIYTEQCTFLLDNSIPESIVPIPVERTYDDLYVTVFTCNKDISITGGVLDTEAENLVLTADCLLTTDGDFTLRGYEFLIQLPHSILNSNPSCQMQFRYQNEPDYVSQTGDTIPVQIIGAMP